MKRSAAVLWLVLIQGVAHGAESTPDGERAAAEAAYRATGNLNRLAVMRAAVEESDLPDDVRDEAVRLMDQTKASILKVVKEESASPSDDAERKRKMAAVCDPFSRDIRKVLSEDEVRTLSALLQLIYREIGLLIKEDLAEKMEPLSLTEKQMTDIKAASDKKRDAIKDLDAKDGIPIEEKRIDLLVATRKQVRGILTDDQRKSWDAQVKAQDQEQQRQTLPRSGIVVPKQPKPAPPADK